MTAVPCSTDRCAVGAPAPGMHRSAPISSAARSDSSVPVPPGPPDALSCQSADPEPTRAWYILPRPGPTGLAGNRAQRYPGRKVIRLEFLSADRAHACNAARYLLPP